MLRWVRGNCCKPGRACGWGRTPGRGLAGRAAAGALQADNFLEAAPRPCVMCVVVLCCGAPSLLGGRC